MSDTYQNGYEYYGCDSGNGVGKYNKKYYEQLRDDYNSYELNDDYKYFMLLTLIIYSFNNQIRFNSKGLLCKWARSGGVELRLLRLYF